MLILETALLKCQLLDQLNAAKGIKKITINIFRDETNPLSYLQSAGKQISHLFSGSTCRCLITSASNVVNAAM